MDQASDFAREERTHSISGRSFYRPGIAEQTSKRKTLGSLRNAPVKVVCYRSQTSTGFYEGTKKQTAGTTPHLWAQLEHTKDL